MSQIQISSPDVTPDVVKSFKLTMNAARANVTGDGTTYIINFDKVLWNDSLGTPSGGQIAVTDGGRYFLSSIINVNTLGAANTSSTINFIVNGTNQQQSFGANIGTMRDLGTGSYVVSIFTTIDLSAGNLVGIRAVVSGGSKTVGIFEQSPFIGRFTSFEGFKIS